MSDIVDRFPAVVARLTGGEYKRAGGGITFRCPCAERHRHGDRNPSCRLYIGRAGALMAKCMGCGAGFAELSRVAGLPPTDWFPDHQKKKGGGTRMQVVARYVYRHADGSVYGTKTRFEPKTFGWSRPLPGDLRELCGIPPRTTATVEGRRAMEQGWFKAEVGRDGAWRFKPAPGGENDGGAILIPAAGPCPLFGVCDLLARDPDKGAVAVCEGEKDALTLARMGFAAVCGPHGSNVWEAEYSRLFADRAAVLFPHNDSPGASYMERVAGSLLRHGCRELRVLEPGTPGYDLQPGGDVSDWRAGLPHRAAARDALRAIVATLPRWTRTGGG